jgi:hypothetical protein
MLVKHGLKIPTCQACPLCATMVKYTVLGSTEVSMVKQIQLTKGYVALVDDDDYEWLPAYSWSFHSMGYAGHTATQSDWRHGKTILMHREIAEVHFMVEPGQDVDHIDGNGLNNQKSNLRAATRAQNLANKRKSFTNTSGYKGVHLHKKVNTYNAQIMIAGKLIGLGSYVSRHHAALIYNAAATFYNGEYARLNEVPPQYVVALSEIPLPVYRKTRQVVEFILQSLADRAAFETVAQLPLPFIAPAPIEEKAS